MKLEEKDWGVIKIEEFVPFHRRKLYRRQYCSFGDFSSGELGIL